MIGFAGLKWLKKGKFSPQDLNSYPHSLPEDWAYLKADIHNK